MLLTEENMDSMLLVLSLHKRTDGTSLAVESEDDEEDHVLIHLDEKPDNESTGDIESYPPFRSLGKIRQSSSFRCRLLHSRYLESIGLGLFWYTLLFMLVFDMGLSRVDIAGPTSS